MNTSLEVRKLLRNLIGIVVGVTVKPSLYKEVQSVVNNAYGVFSHSCQREDICIFYDRKSLYQHLQSHEKQK